MGLLFPLGLQIADQAKSHEEYIKYIGKALPSVFHKHSTDSLDNNRNIYIFFNCKC